MLDQEIQDKLKAPVSKDRVKHREGGGGRSLAYLKGHDVIDQANEIFGFGQWGYDTLSVELVNVVAENGEVVGSYYAARVRLSVAGCIPITEEGVNPIQEGRNPRAKIDAHDMARKGAVTDAMKRALRCYGDQFGNSLYDTDLVDGQPGTEKANTGPAKQQSQPQTTRPANPPNQSQQSNRTAPAPQPSQATPQPPRPVTPAPTASPNPAPSDEPATEQQRLAIVKMGGRMGMEEIELNRRIKELYAVELKTLSRNDAAHFIKVLQGQV